MAKIRDAIKKVYPHDHEAVLVCEQCGNTKVINTVKYEKLKKPLRIKCGCGFQFLVSIETRKYYRKSTRLYGEYAKVGTKGVAGRMIIRNLSRTGLGFEMAGDHALRPDDILRIRFTLDDRMCTEIHKKVIVRNMQDRFVGAEFCDLEPYESVLGFYLMNG